MDTHAVRAHAYRMGDTSYNDFTGFHPSDIVKGAIGDLAVALPLFGKGLGAGASALLGLEEGTDGRRSHRGYRRRIYFELRGCGRDRYHQLSSVALVAIRIRTSIPSRSDRRASVMGRIGSMGRHRRRRSNVIDTADDAPQSRSEPGIRSSRNRRPEMKATSKCRPQPRNPMYPAPDIAASSPARNNCGSANRNQRIPPTNPSESIGLEDSRGCGAAQHDAIRQRADRRSTAVRRRGYWVAGSSGPRLAWIDLANAPDLPGPVAGPVEVSTVNPLNMQIEVTEVATPSVSPDSMPVQPGLPDMGGVTPDPGREPQPGRNGRCNIARSESSGASTRSSPNSSAVSANRSRKNNCPLRLRSTCKDRYVRPC